ncbi:MAG: response regulator transcription factor [Clostridia bacterium]|nr:response regulator transcription factor [Clostridia bacterium]
MRILLTISDRDLLKALETLLEADGHELATAFDGVQALAKVDDAEFELAVVDNGLARVELETLAADIAGRGIPVVVLTDKIVTRELLEQALPVCAYLPYPFEPDALRAVLSETADKTTRKATFTAGDVLADEGGSRLRYGNGVDAAEICVTAAELEFLKAVAGGGELPDGFTKHIYIGALNTKFGRLGAHSRIAYIPGKGYGLVTDNG